VDFVIYIASIGSLILGINTLIIHSGFLALKFKIPKFLMATILIVLGSSLPEITNSIMANFYNRQAVAISNLVGSNIFNMIFILPILIIFSKQNILLKIKRFKDDISWIFLITVFFLIVSLDGKIDLIESIFLILTMGLYIFSTLKEPLIYDEDELLLEKFNIIKSILLTIIGFIFLIVGSYFTIESALSIKNTLGFSNWNIGLFIALSTALPKLTILLPIIFRGKEKVAISYLLKSSLANFTLGIGLSGVIRDISIFEANILDFAILLFVTTMTLVGVSNRVYTKPISLMFLAIFILFLLKHWVY